MTRKKNGKKSKSVKCRSALDVYKRNHGTTDEELAESLGIGRPYFTRIRRGERAIKPRLAFLIYEKTGVKVGCLEGERAAAIKAARRILLRSHAA